MQIAGNVSDASIESAVPTIRRRQGLRILESCDSFADFFRWARFEGFTAKLDKSGQADKALSVERHTKLRVGYLLLAAPARECDCKGLFPNLSKKRLFIAVRHDTNKLLLNRTGALQTIPRD